METIDSSVINAWLATMPCVPLSTQPLFRLVWSDEQYELRTGVFAKFIANVKVSEEKRTQNVLKYNWIKERWIVEQWFPPEVCLVEELPESIRGSYEPIYVFEDKGGNALPLKLEVVQFLVKQCLKPKTSAMLKKSISAENTEAREKVAAKQDWEQLADEGPLVSQFHDGTAILNVQENL
jgi:hypothetical protein